MNSEGPRALFCISVRFSTRLQRRARPGLQADHLARKVSSCSRDAFTSFFASFKKLSGEGGGCISSLGGLLIRADCTIAGALGGEDGKIGAQAVALVASSSQCRRLYALKPGLLIPDPFVAAPVLVLDRPGPGLGLARRLGAHAFGAVPSLLHHELASGVGFPAHLVERVRRAPPEHTDRQQRGRDAEDQAPRPGPEEAHAPATCLATRLAVTVTLTFDRLTRSALSQRPLR